MWRRSGASGGAGAEERPHGGVDVPSRHLNLPDHQPGGVCSRDQAIDRAVQSAHAGYPAIEDTDPRDIRARYSDTRNGGGSGIRSRQAEVRTVALQRAGTAIRRTSLARDFTELASLSRFVSQVGNSCADAAAR
jgi:hypothetical protein